MAEEITEELDRLARDGYQIKKLSMVGYSLGGLVARYAIGLLHHQGLFKKIEPVNFTTFVTPHLGELSCYASVSWEDAEQSSQGFARLCVATAIKSGTC